MIERLLSVEFPEVEYFRAQVPAITVTSACGCGCGTIGFAVDAKLARRAPSAVWDDELGPIAEGDSRSWLMLFQSGGWLTELEHVAGHRPNPEQLDAQAIEPELEVESDWFI